MLVLDLYWVTQGLAFLYPGTHWCDEGFCFDTPFAPQLGVEVVGIVLNGCAYGVEVWQGQQQGDEVGKVGRKGL